MKSMAMMVGASVLGSAMTFAVMAMGAWQPVTWTDEETHKISEWTKAELARQQADDATRMDFTKSIANLPRPVMAATSNFVCIVSPDGTGWVVSASGAATEVRVQQGIYAGKVNFLTSSTTDETAIRMAVERVLLSTRPGSDLKSIPPADTQRAIEK